MKAKYIRRVMEDGSLDTSTLRRACLVWGEASWEDAPNGNVPQSFGVRHSPEPLEVPEGWAAVPNDGPTSARYGCH
jgi:hypothetical protein